MNSIKLDKRYISVATDREIKRNSLCNNCYSTKRLLTLQLIPTNRKNFTYPKYIPQIKETCANCACYIRFAPQTPELIAQLNQKLQEAAINA